MLFSADQLVAHAVGDYCVQTDHMAQEKVRSLPVALAHGATYALPFLLLTRRRRPLLAIALSHAVIDRYRLPRYYIWCKNRALSPAAYRRPWAECSATGFPPDRPAWLTVWLLIIVDNVMHVACNGAALRWL